MAKDLKTQSDLQSILRRSVESLDDELAYITKNRIVFESDEKELREKSEQLQLRQLIVKLLKIAAVIAVTLLLLFAIWWFLFRLRNRKAYSFPEVAPKGRLGATYAATSISQIND